VLSPAALDRSAVLAWAGHHPYARFALARAARVTGLRGAGALLLVTETDVARMGHGLGEPAAVDALFDRAVRVGALASTRWVNLPRRTGSSIPAGFELNEHWDFRWILGPVPPQPGQDRVVALGPDDADAINGLLDVAFPASMVRPGHPMARRWYGIRAGSTLVACAADRSARSPDPTAEPVGVIGGVATHPAYRRQGLAAAVTAALTGRLQASYGLVTLGVIAGNDPATRMYERLGFTGITELTSVRPAAT
jgi:ribosomal protein S18 acetylase RimI-like enzyme